MIINRSERGIKVKKMKKAILNVVFLSMLVFAGCRKEEIETPPTLVNNVITAKVEKGKNYDSVFKTVKANTVYLPENYVVAFGLYVDGGFSLTLPESIDFGRLLPITNEFAFSGATISNHSARVLMISIDGYDSDDNKVDYFVYKHKSANIIGYLIYVDRDVKITGSDGYNMYNMDIKKGWNMAFNKNNGYGYQTNNFTNVDQTNYRWYRNRDLD